VNIVSGDTYRTITQGCPRLCCFFFQKVTFFPAETIFFHVETCQKHEIRDIRIPPKHKKSRRNPKETLFLTPFASYLKPKIRGILLTERPLWGVISSLSGNFLDHSAPKCGTVTLIRKKSSNFCVSDPLFFISLSAGVRFRQKKCSQPHPPVGNVWKPISIKKNAFSSTF
jgi:hypothetical protein